jgi:hypothetical protein
MFLLVICVCAMKEAFDFWTFALLFVGISWAHRQCVLFFLRPQTDCFVVRLQVSRDFVYKACRQERETEYYRVENIRGSSYSCREVVKTNSHCLPSSAVVRSPRL